MFRRPQMGVAALFAWSAVLLLISSLLMSSAAFAKSGAHKKTPAHAKGTRAHAALGGFVKDRALAGMLGEILFRDTLDVMSDPAALSTVAPTASSAATAGTASGLANSMPAPANSGVAPGGSGAADQFRDSSAAGRVARAVLAHRSLDRYLWLVRRAYDDTLWKGGDRGRIQQHFPLIWRTSIMMYEATLGASPHRVRVCTPTVDIDEFDCHDELAHAKMVPIPTQAPLFIASHQPNMG